MEVYLYDHSLTGIEAMPGGKKEGVNHNRIRFHQEGSMVSVWLTRDQAEEVRRAVDVLYPREGVRDTPPTLDPAAEEALATYADTHAGDDKSCPVEGEVVATVRPKLDGAYSYDSTASYLCPNVKCHADNLSLNGGYCSKCGTALFPADCYTTKEEATV